MIPQPEAPTLPKGGGPLNTPPSPEAMAALLADQDGPPPGLPPRENPSPQDVGAAIAQATAGAVPTMPDTTDVVVELPAGWLTEDGLLVTQARCRELNGFDEERLSRIDMMKNVAVYMTELLMLGVDELGGAKPDRKVIQDLLIGDRDTLMLGIRQATYGNEVEFNLTCAVCDNESKVQVQLDSDVEYIRMDDPLVREFEVPLRRGGTARVKLLNGTTQEAFSADLGKKTPAEINTIMLAKSVIAINGKPVRGRTEDVLALPAADRQKITDFIGEHQPGPQLNKEIRVPCAVCAEEYPVLLGLSNLFRF